MRLPVRFKLFVVVVAVAMFAGCASQKPSGKLENVVEARATVTAIDLSRREMTLKDSKGRAFIVEVLEQVKGLDQIRVGDEVVVSYTEALAWQVKPADEGAPGITSDTGVTTTKADDRPGGTVGRTISLTATITRIDLADGTVTLTGPGGNSRTFKARDPSNLKKVHVGELVDITYTEALVASIQSVANK